ncbi:hypothetical protein D187_005477 [Cystobacter fuscus DSM 2262]|uniref:Uncharacterized protein n=1 Tax=Cystobacter fuscus (strain ATCC 25194 / DSM 2262 / NBRC 100088 / M29) TaxID=1242864 RepID=S9R5T6_CYSF2|nr:hypothetical protein D187_005477 [Cystobacter fuscus DSM 2262]
MAVHDRLPGVLGLASGVLPAVRWTHPGAWRPPTLADAHGKRRPTHGTVLPDRSR